MGLKSWQEQEIFLFSKISRSVLGPSQPPTGKVLWCQSVPGAKQPGCEADCSPACTAKLHDKQRNNLTFTEKSDFLKLKVNVKLTLWQAMWLEIMQGCRGTAPHTFQTLVLYGREW